MSIRTILTHMPTNNTHIYKSLQCMNNLGTWKSNHRRYFPTRLLRILVVASEAIIIGKNAIRIGKKNARDLFETRSLNPTNRRIFDFCRAPCWGSAKQIRPKSRWNMADYPVSWTSVISMPPPCLCTFTYPILQSSQRSRLPPLIQ